MTDVYQRLAKHLDNLPGGFPPTESGVEDSKAAVFENGGGNRPRSDHDA